MWRLFGILLFWLWISPPTMGQSAPQRVTQLQLREWELFEDIQFLVTLDSLVVRRQGLGVGKDTLYRRALTLAQRDQLLASVDRTYLSAIQARYECESGVSCPALFELTLQKGIHQKATTIIDCRVTFLLAFATELNRLVPATYHSRYIRHLQIVAKSPSLLRVKSDRQLKSKIE